MTSMNVKKTRGLHFKNSELIYYSNLTGLSNKQSSMFVFEMLTVHGGMRASIPWMHRGVKISR